jgi:hypothetical protein
MIKPPFFWLETTKALFEIQEGFVNLGVNQGLISIVSSFNRVQNR